MDDFNGDVRDALANVPAPPDGQAERLAGEQVEGLARRLRWAGWLARGLVIACVLFGLYCFVEFRRAEDVRGMLGWAVLILIMYESTVLMKLWYWVVHTRISVQKDLKELQLQLAALREQLRK